jgi:3-phenylpropionate/trans-cinnamate dioxygenase ferredoxin subunit
MIYVSALADLPRGAARRLPVEPPVSVFHTDAGDLYAIDDTCTHQDASLADGWLEECWIECPLHAAVFDLRTGEADGLLAREPVRTHHVLVQEEQVYVVLAGQAGIESGGDDRLDEAS